MTTVNHHRPDAMLRKPSPRTRRLVLRIATGLVIFFAAIALLVTELAVQADDKAKLPNAAPEPLVAKKADSPDTSESFAHVESMVITDKQNFLMPRSFTGVIAARQSSELAFKLSGRVEKMLVDQGDFVKKGQVLAELDKATLEANLAVLKAQRNAAESRLRELVAGPRRQTIEAARAQLKEIESLRDLARTTYDRRMQLAASDAISKQDIDDARLQLSATEGRYDAQQQVLSELEEGTRPEQIDAQRAEVEQIDANIRSLTIDLNESQLRSPYDAVVARRMADEGTVVSPGATILKIVEHAAPEAWIGVPPEMIAALKIGDAHTLRHDDLVLRGKVKAFLPELDPVSRTQTVIFEIEPDPQDQSGAKASALWNSAVLGQIVQLELVREVKQTGFWIPMTALTRGNRGLWTAYVLAKEESNPTSQDNADAIYTLRPCHVEIIQIDSAHVFVRGTLKSGDRIVVAGLQKLTPGQRVKIATTKEGA